MQYPIFRASASLVSAVSHAVDELFGQCANDMFQAGLQLKLHSYYLGPHECAQLLQQVAHVLASSADAQVSYRNTFMRHYHLHREEQQSEPHTSSAAYAHQWAVTILT